MTPEELHNIHRAESGFWWYAGMRAVTWALLDGRIPPGFSSGLDAGCGTGMNALAFENRYGIRMHGVDLAPLAAEYCRARGFSRAAVASVLLLPFADNSMDLISSLDVLSHVDGDEQALREFHRVLSPGGWLVLRVPAFPSLRSRHSQFIAERRRYRAGELSSMLRLQGFSVFRSTYANFFLSPVAWLKFRIWENLTHQKPQSGVSEAAAPWLNRLLLLILQSEAALIRAGFRLPFGQSLMVLARKS